MAFGYGSKKRRIEQTRRLRREEKQKKRLNKNAPAPPADAPAEPIVETPAAEASLPAETT